MRPAVILTLVLLVAPTALAESELTEEELARLRTEKVLVGERAFAQVFDAYKGGGMPYLVTSDAVIGGFHALLEQSMMRLEVANAAALPDVLDAIFDKLNAAAEGATLPAPLAQKAGSRARIVLAVARILLGGWPSWLLTDEMEVAREEAKLVQEAKARALPAWFTEARPDFQYLDYSRFKVRGLYTRRPDLARFHRAMSWLTALPLWVEEDSHLLAFLLIRRAIDLQADGGAACRRVLGGYEELIGPGDDVSTVNWSRSVDGPIDRRRFEMIRHLLARDARKETIRDLAALPEARRRSTVRILSAARLPGTVLFQRLKALHPLDDRLPGGREVCAALGSDWAAEGLAEDAREVIGESGELFSAKSVYCQLLECLGTLLAEPDERRPAFLRTPAWRRKSHHSALSGWTLARNVFSLRTKRFTAILGGSSAPGFVEPVPEFFRGMVSLIDRCGSYFKDRGAFEGSMLAEDIAVVFDAYAAFLERVDLEVYRGDSFWETALEDPVLGRVGFNELNGWYEGSLPPVDRQTATAQDKAKRIRQCRGIARELRAGTGKIPEPLRWVFARRDFRIEDQWRDLHELCGELAGLAHRQLKNKPFRDKDRWLIRGFGGRLARIMFQEITAGGSDDAPRAVDLIHDPARNRWLHAGVARPRALYVLYPWEGEEVLCRGVVLPYREFLRERPVTDEEWKRILDTEDIPPPAWLR